MLTVFWNPEGFLVVDLLPKGIRFNSEYFINNILKNIFQITAERRAECHRKVTFHFDNSRPHTSRKAIQYMDVHHMKRAPHPPFSPDIAASDFYLFGYFKDRLVGLKFESLDELFECINEFL